MTDLRKLAKGQECLIRVPGYCNFNPETTVGCHYRLSGISGIGMKAPDLLMAFGCSSCHAVVDGQQKSSWSRQELLIMLAEGVFRTQAWLVQKGILKW